MIFYCSLWTKGRKKATARRLLLAKAGSMPFPCTALAARRPPGSVFASNPSASAGTERNGTERCEQAPACSLPMTKLQASATRCQAPPRAGLFAVVLASMAREVRRDIVACFFFVCVCQLSYASVVSCRAVPCPLPLLV